MIPNFVFLLVLIIGLFQPFSLSAKDFYQEHGVPDPRFGITEAFWSGDEAAELNIGWERILFYWREIQPTGPEDWNTLHVREEWLDQADAQGRMVVGLLKNTAPWASEDGTEAGLPRGLYLPIDDPDNLWASFVRRIADYYGQRNVHHWIIWNEPEIDSDTYGFEFSGTTRDYFQMVKIAYQVMKQTDPEAIIHLAGLTWWHDQYFLKSFLQYADADPDSEENGFFFDVISLHIYFRTETIRTILETVRATQAQFNIDKPIWINEMNAPPNLDPLWQIDRQNFQVDLEQQAWFILQSSSLALAAGASAVGVYKLLDIHLPPGGESYGLLRPDFSRRPAFYAYKTTIQYLSGFEEVDLEIDNKYYVASFINSQQVTRVMWARTPISVTLKLPALSASASYANFQGLVGKINPAEGNYTLELPGARCYDECIIGGSPILLTESTELTEVEAMLSSERIRGTIPPLSEILEPTKVLEETPEIIIQDPTVAPSISPDPIMTPTPYPIGTSTIESNISLSEIITNTSTSVPMSPRALFTPTPIEDVRIDENGDQMLLYLISLGTGSSIIVGLIFVGFIIRKNRE